MSKTARGLLLLLLAGARQGAVKLPALLSDHMVLQRGMPVRIWGSADAGEAVRVEFQGQTAAAKADASGKWTAWLKPLAAAGQHGNDRRRLQRTITIKDVLVGEVWLASGQSNAFTGVRAFHRGEPR